MLTIIFNLLFNFPLVCLVFCHDKMTLNSRVSYLGNHRLHYLLFVIKFKRSEFYQSSPTVCFHKWRFSAKLTANILFQNFAFPLGWGLYEHYLILRASSGHLRHFRPYQCCATGFSAASKWPKLN